MQGTPKRHKTENPSNAKVTYLVATVDALTERCRRTTKAALAIAEEVAA